MGVMVGSCNTFPLLLLLSFEVQTALLGMFFLCSMFTVASRVSNLVVVDADDTIRHQRWQCRHWMTPLDTGMNLKIHMQELLNYKNTIFLANCFSILETSNMVFFNFCQIYQWMKKKLFLQIPKTWVFSSHPPLKSKNDMDINWNDIIENMQALYWRNDYI